ncbi:MAG TPA: acyltransferase [Chitinophagaceae bacterium]|jgi:acetyltransferase-like isoleucine patch superfamily enzyme|nr:acyltransferase [Chitinophagaceae bacterium]
MRTFLNKMVSKWKGHSYQLDENIPTSYLLRLCIGRAWMMVRGKFSGIQHRGSFFFSWKATVKCRSKLSVGRSATIDSGAYIDALSTDGLLFGDNVSVGRNTRISGTGNMQLLGKGMKLGNNIGLGINSFYGCGGGIEIGDDTIIGDFVSFHAENHAFDTPAIPIRLQGVTRQGIRIGRNCWIGAKATILDGVVIEDGCVIAAGAVVTAGIYPANTIYGGVPAKQIGKVSNTSSEFLVQSSTKNYEF